MDSEKQVRAQIRQFFTDFDRLCHSRLLWSCKSQNIPVFCGQQQLQQQQTDRLISLSFTHERGVIITHINSAIYLHAMHGLNLGVEESLHA